MKEEIDKATLRKMKRVRKQIMNFLECGFGQHPNFWSVRDQILDAFGSFGRGDLDDDSEIEHQLELKFNERKK